MPFEGETKWLRTAGSLLLLLGLQLAGCKAPQVAFKQQIEARRLTAQLMLNVTRAADAGNRAVMADTDESSRQFADEARAQTHEAQQTVDHLDGVLHSLLYDDEVKLLGEFRKAFDKSRALDDELLGLAVENTNLKAQQLSLGPARQAADAFRAALDHAASAAPTKTQTTVRVLTLTAILGIRETEVLEAPHIAASEAAVMTALEKPMTVALESVQHALDELDQLHDATSTAAIAEATDAFSRFKSLHEQVLVLSRRNSNVRSLALALGQKRMLTAESEATLRALSAGIDKHDLKATR